MVRGTIHQAPVISCKTLGLFLLLRTCKENSILSLSDSDTLSISSNDKSSVDRLSGENVC
jgi:hypothetical protein